MTHQRLKLTIGVTQGVARADNPDVDDATRGLRAVRPNILKRDNNTCRYCEFEAASFQHVHHLSGNHSDNAPQNLVTACLHCHMCQHLGFVGAQARGVLIALPTLEKPKQGRSHHMAQAELNWIQKVLWVGMRAKDPRVTQNCTSLYEAFQHHREAAKCQIGTFRPELVGHLLGNASPKEKQALQRDLKGIGLLLAPEHYKAETEYWEKTLFADMPLEQWVEYAGKLHKNFG